MAQLSRNLMKNKWQSMIIYKWTVYFHKWFASYRSAFVCCQTSLRFSCSYPCRRNDYVCHDLRNGVITKASQDPQEIRPGKNKVMCLVSPAPGTNTHLRPGLGRILQEFNFRTSSLSFPILVKVAAGERFAGLVPLQRQFSYRRIV